MTARYVLFGAIVGALAILATRAIQAEMPALVESSSAQALEESTSGATEPSRRERALLLCQTAGALVEPHVRAIDQASARHNRLRGVPHRELADALTAVLVTENSGSVLWRMPAMLDALYPVWDGLQVASNSMGLDYSVGVGRIRPHTALQLRQGWIEHQRFIIYHAVRISLPADGSAAYSSARLAENEVSIEYLAANFEMGTAVAHAFGVEPTVLDLARWHNTGIGPWGWDRTNRNEELWEKGTRYLTRVEDATKTLASINGLGGCAELRSGRVSVGEETD